MDAADEETREVYARYGLVDIPELVMGLLMSDRAAGQGRAQATR
jgi:hypothetical protein